MEHKPPSSGAIGTAVALSMALGVCPQPLSAQEADRTAAAPDPGATQKLPIALEPGAIRGRVMDLDGKTPAVGARVTLRDREGKVVGEAETDAAGHFAVGSHEAGEYRLAVGRAAGPLVVKSGAKATSIILVMPKELARPIHKAQGEAEPNPEPEVEILGIGMSETTAAAIALVVFVGAVAGGIAAGVAANQHHHHHPSP